MRFETLLARRYISAQKRHAALTVCSIAIAVALMSMLFCLYSTFISIRRSEAYDDLNGHFAFYNISEEQAEKMKSLPEVSKVKRANEQNGWTVTYVTVDKYIEDESQYLTKLETAAGLNNHINEEEDETKPVFANINDELLSIDLLTDSGRFEMAFYFGVFFILVLILMMLLRLVIDTAFEISSKERERQFGVLQSIGATPKQIVRVMTSEGLFLSAVGVPLGGALGILLGFVTFRAVLTTGISSVIFDSTEKINKYVRYSVNPWMLAGGMLLGFVWVMFSAYGTGMRVIRKSPMEAMTARQSTVKKVRRHSLSGLLFGWTGKLAFRNARRQRKRFVITILSLSISLVLFAIFGTVMNRAEAFVRSMRYEVDLFGYVQSDFALSIESAEPNAETALKTVKQLEESGLFQNVEFSQLIFTNRLEDHPESSCVLAYVNRATYDRIWRYCESPMSYDAFLSYGKAIVFHKPEGLELGKEGEISLTLSVEVEITEEEAQAAMEKDGSNRDIVRVGAGTSDDPYRYYMLQKRGVSYPYGMKASSPYAESSSVMGLYDLVLLRPTEQLEADEKQFGLDLGRSVFGQSLNCNLKEGADYKQAITYLESAEDLVIMDDHYEFMRRASTVIAAVKTAGLFVTLMVALIAIVNMINIISTGIINRKSELAALQCSGMTRGQMYRMAVIECLQFVLRSAIIAAALSCLIIFGTEKFLYWLIQADAQGMVTDPSTAMLKQFSAGLDSGHIASYGFTLVKVFSAAAAAFAVSLFASLIPMHRMQKEPLIEQVRAVE